MERVEMEHGDSSTTYTPTSVWTFEPTHGVRRSIRLQTDSVPEVRPQPEARGAAPRETGNAESQTECEKKDVECQMPPPLS